MSFFKNTNSPNDTNKQPNSALYERKKQIQQIQQIQPAKDYATNILSIKLSEVVSVVLVVFVVFKISNELLVLKSQTGYL